MGEEFTVEGIAQVMFNAGSDGIQRDNDWWGYRSDFLRNEVATLRTELANKERETAEKCSVLIEIQQDRVKHTTHRDGIGMGSLCCEGELASMATYISQHFGLDK